MGVASLGGTISLGTAGLAWFPDVGRHIPATEATGNPDTSIVHTGKLMSEGVERSTCCGQVPVPSAQSRLREGCPPSAILAL